MEKNPFTFDKTNPRMVVGMEKSPMVYTAAGVIFVASLAWYQKRYFRIDQNAANFLGFTLASIPASMAYANVALSSGCIEAAAINNERENQR